MPACSVVFIQRMAHKAGAQACLAKLLEHERIRALDPVLVISEDGWLTTECGRLGIRCIQTGFPSSRSIKGRLYANSLFARDVKNKLEALGICPSIVHANDHNEGLLALELAKTLGAKSAMFLRSSAMSRRDYFKYGCDRFGLVAAVCESLRKKASEWDGRVGLIPDGLHSREFAKPKGKPGSFPDRLLVIGSEAALKGWADLLDALKLLARDGALPRVTFDFTGKMPGDSWKDHAGLKGIEFNFLGRVNEFMDLARRYDLVLNTSRSECFGTASLEVLAAGVPILSSRTGVIEEVMHHEHLLFSPHDPAGLADTLKRLVQGWSELDTDISSCQDAVMQKYGIDIAVDRLLEGYERLLDG